METTTPLLMDWYKMGHPYQYHPNIDLVYSNGTARKSRIPEIENIVVFSIQSFIKKYLIEHFNKNFFSRPEEEVIKEFSRRVRTSLGSDLKPLKHKFYQENFPNDPYGHIRHLHRLGYLPMIIKSLPEGSLVPIRVPFFTVRNDRKKHPELYWLTNAIETLMSTSTWQGITSATIAREYRKIFNEGAMETVGNTDFVPFQGHDFSFRGMSSLESACYSGAGHLLSFVGTDTIPAIDFLEQYYSANCEQELIGASVPATEHAVMCSNTGFYVWDNVNGDWDRIGECEFDVFKYIITELYPDGIVSIVSDTWDLWRVILTYLKKLKNEILSRDGKVVIRPDSGDPVHILCGHEYTIVTSIDDGELYHVETSHIYYDGKFYKLDSDDTGFQTIFHLTEVEEHVIKGVVELLWDIFGGTYSPKGYKLLDSHIGTIYGDSITIARAKHINSRLKYKGFATINWVAGIGSYTYQYNTRDTFGMAIKATYCEARSNDGETIYEIPIFKDPITDDGTKKSARGLLRVDEVVLPDGKITYTFKDNVSWEEESGGALEVVFENGVLVKEQSLSEIRERLLKTI